ncbi:hypothetical protein L6452_05593 [Arctium lappa]|uniref:Uncharacterized protein n=1 Tax=Arctium lappa TaxID=4217 RepID=A0ACB9EH47_ARCLA|nr:hypothetical protein L6452_05593 [Arctium lappa]
MTTNFRDKVYISIINSWSGGGNKINERGEKRGSTVAVKEEGDDERKDRCSDEVLWRDRGWVGRDGCVGGDGGVRKVIWVKRKIGLK